MSRTPARTAAWSSTTSRRVGSRAGRLRLCRTALWLDAMVVIGFLLVWSLQRPGPAALTVWVSTLILVRANQVVPAALSGQGPAAHGLPNAAARRRAGSDAARATS